MPNFEHPGGIRGEWRGRTLTLHLPEPVETSHHVLEPVLSRKDAVRVREEVDRQGGPLERVVLVRDVRFAEEGAARFQAKLLAELGHAGQTPRSEIIVKGDLMPQATRWTDLGGDTDPTPIPFEPPAGLPSEAAPEVAPPDPMPGPEPGPTPGQPPAEAPPAAPGRGVVPVRKRRFGGRSDEP